MTELAPLIVPAMSVSLKDRVLEIPWVYRTWQAPFSDSKLEPFVRHADLVSVKRVLDVGCGPGTNVPHFADVDYVGVDINPEYIAQASRKFGRRFLVGDVSDPSVLPDEEFDLVFANSLMHHIPDSVVDRLLNRMAELCTEEGRVHVLDLVLPARRSIPRLLAKADRGKYPRPEGEWRALFTRHLDEVHSETYMFGGYGFKWEMIYFIGQPR
jgi:SAM-dependent methyltransferase